MKLPDAVPLEGGSSIFAVARWTATTDVSPAPGNAGNVPLQVNEYLEEPAIADVWRSSDGGVTWTELDPPPWVGRGMVYRPVEHNALASSRGRLWLLNGFSGTEELSRALFSDDDGATWSELPGGSGGGASHADAVLAADDVVLRVSGSLSERNVYQFSRGP